jgi:hypothetical protein
LELREKGLKLSDDDLVMTVSAWQAGFWTNPIIAQKCSKPSDDDMKKRLKELGFHAPFYGEWAFKKVGDTWHIREETEVRSDLPPRGHAAPAGGMSH